LTSYIGEEIEAKILELDRQRNNIVLSRKAHLEEEQSGERQSFLEDLEVGNIKEGKISSIVNFGAFVDIGGKFLKLITTRKEYLYQLNKLQKTHGLILNCSTNRMIL